MSALISVDILELISLLLFKATVFIFRFSAYKIPALVKMLFIFNVRYSLLTLPMFVRMPECIFVNDFPPILLCKPLFSIDAAFIFN